MLEELLLKELEPGVLKIVTDYLEKTGVRLRIVQVIVDGVMRNEIKGIFHIEFEKILKLLENNIPIMLVGPAGSGKNECIRQVAEAMDLQMYYTNNVSNEF